MSLSRVKKDILEELWKESVPITATDLSRRLNLKYQVVVMHISELEKMGYVECKQKGYYSITQPGTEALGFPALTAELAKKILSPLPLESLPLFHGNRKLYWNSCNKSTGFLRKDPNNRQTLNWIPSFKGRF